MVRLVELGINEITVYEEESLEEGFTLVQPAKLSPNGEHHVIDGQTSACFCEGGCSTSSGKMTGGPSSNNAWRVQGGCCRRWFSRRQIRPSEKGCQNSSKKITLTATSSGTSTWVTVFRSATIADDVMRTFVNDSHSTKGTRKLSHSRGIWTEGWSNLIF